MDSFKIDIRLVACCLIALFCTNDVCWGENSDYSPEVLRIGYSSKFFLSSVSVADAQVALSLWTRELTPSSTLKTMQPKPLIFDNLQSIVKALNNRTIDFVAVTAIDYLKIRDRAPLEPAFVGSRRNAVGGDELVLLVRRDQGIRDISQLKGKRLIVHSGPIIETAHLWLSSVMARRSLPDYERFFGSDKEVNKASQAVLPVFFKQSDACLVSKSAYETMVELNPQIGKELTVLLSSDKLLDGIFCFHKLLRADIKAKMTKIAVNIHSTASGKQILTLFQIDDITPFNPSMLDPTMALLDKRKHPEGRPLAGNQRAERTIIGERAE